MRVDRDKLTAERAQRNVDPPIVFSKFGQTGIRSASDTLNYPPRGYWAKKAAGKKVVQSPLPPPVDGTPSAVRIVPTPPRPRPPELSPETQSVLEQSRQDAKSSIVVPETLRRPHPIVRAWLDEIDKRKREARAERESWRKKMLLDGTDLTPLESRRHLLLDTLFKTLEQNRIKVRQGDRHELLAEPGGEPVEFQLREKQKMGRRPLDEWEQKWKKAGEPDTKRAALPSGKLTFVIKTYLPSGFRQEWLENDETTLEELLPDIVATFVAVGPPLVERRKEREEQARQGAIRERQRQEEQQRRRRDNNRWRRLVDLAHQRRDALLVQELLTALRSTDFDSTEVVGDQTIAEWMAWAEEKSNLVDPAGDGASGVFAELASVTEWTYRD